MAIRFLVPITIALLFLPLFASAAACPNLYRNLSFGLRGTDVVELQTFLIAEGDLAAGNNTGYFGRLTRDGVRKFQCREMQICSGSEATNGYGAVGPRTRAKIASMCGGGGKVSGNFTASPTLGTAPLSVRFSYIPGAIADAFRYQIDFGDGTNDTDSSVYPPQTSCDNSYPGHCQSSHLYASPGNYTAKLHKVDIRQCPSCGGDITVGTVTITITSGAVSNLSCTSDSQCPNSYYCEMIEGHYGTCSATITPGPNGQTIPGTCTPNVITKGICKPNKHTEGGTCTIASDCTAGLGCSAGVCKKMVGAVCSGANDTSCGYGYQCTQDCGPPVVSQYDTTPVGYHCRLPEDPNDSSTWRQCPICLAGSTLIDTPQGKVAAQDVKTGMPVWTTDAALNRIVGIVTAISKVPVANHHVVKLVLDDGRKAIVSAGHSTIDGRTVGDLKAGDSYDGASVVSAELVPYTEDATYDLLPSGDTGFYWADGILLGSTLTR